MTGGNSLPVASVPTSGGWFERPIPRLLTRYAWRYRYSYAAGAAFLVLTNWLAVSIPIEIGAAVDALKAVGGSVGGGIGRHVAAVAAMGVAVIVVRTLSRILIFNPGRHVEYLLRRDLFSCLLRHQPSFYATRKRGDIVSRAANDISWVRTLVGYGGLQVVNVALAVTLTGWKMIALSPHLTGLVLLPIGVGMFVVQWSIHRLFRLSLRNQEQLGEISEHVLGSLQGMAAVQGFAAEQAFEKRFEQRNADWLRISMRLAMIRAVALPLLVLAGGIAMFVLLLVGGRLVLAGTMTVGQLVAFSALVTVLLPTLRSLGWMLSVVQRGRAALGRIFELMEVPVDRPEGTRGLTPQAGRGPRIELVDLSFAYPDESDHRVLDGISVTIPGSAVVGLCGRTGSGKTTLLRLLVRQFNPPAGTVLIDGEDILELDLDSWRQRLAVVPQRPFLFSDSIASNVAMSEQPGPDAVARAVELAALGPDIEVLPDGVETVVGERGIMLSGGQRQRVALARGLYRSGDLIVLDDVLSAVDHTTEAALVETLTRLGRRPGGPTVLLASHRLSALRHADLILVLERGRVVDVGAHAELIARPGPYRDTWRAQRSRTAETAEVAS